MEEKRILSRNNIRHYIFRIDFVKLEEDQLNIIIESFKNQYDRIEKILVPNFNIKVDKNNPTIDRNDLANFVLINETTKSKITISCNSNFISFESNNYIDKSTYLVFLEKLVETITSNTLSLDSKRIGMRFINNFPCDLPKGISKFFNKDISKNLIFMSSKKSISRVICQEEYNLENCMCRVQIGILNNFYPSVLKNFDLTLDIDTFDSTTQTYINWIKIASELNHNSYNFFKNSMNESYINSLK